MKRILKSTLALALALGMTFSITGMAYAKELPKEIVSEETTSVAEPDVSSQNATINLSTSWKTVLSSSTGFGCNVAIVCRTTISDGLGILKADVHMLGKNGNLLWSETKSCPGTGTARVYKCGSDVYTIQVKVAGGSGTARAYVTTAPAN